MQRSFGKRVELVHSHAGMLTLMRMLEDGRQNWRRELGECSNETVAWQPFRHGHNIGALMLHVADVEAMWMDAVVAGRKRSDEELALLRSSETNPAESQWPEPYEGWSLQQYYEVQDRIRDRALATLSSISDPQAELTAPDGQTVSVEWVVTYLIGHEAYHAGQAMLHKVHHSWNGMEPS